MGNTALWGAGTALLAEKKNPNISIQTDGLPNSRNRVGVVSCAQVGDNSRKNCCCASEMVFG
jgi:hypothetical protein